MTHNWPIIIHQNAPPIITTQITISTGFREVALEELAHAEAPDPVRAKDSLHGELSTGHSHLHSGVASEVMEL